MKIPRKITPPMLSEDGKHIWQELSFCEQIYCKYCFLQNTTISTVFVGVTSAYLVNIFTNLIGMRFDGWFHITAYLVNAALSVAIFTCVVLLYSIHIDSKEVNDAKQGMKSHHVTLELEFFQKSRKKIKWTLYLLLGFTALLLVITVTYVVSNNLGLVISPAPSISDTELQSNSEVLYP